MDTGYEKRREMLPRAPTRCDPLQDDKVTGKCQRFAEPFKLRHCSACPLHCAATTNTHTHTKRHTLTHIHTHTDTLQVAGKLG